MDRRPGVGVVGLTHKEGPMIRVPARSLSTLLSMYQRQADRMATIQPDAELVYGPYGQCVWSAKSVNTEPTDIVFFGTDHSLRMMVYATPDAREERHMPVFMQTHIFTDPWYFVVGVETDKEPDYFAVRDWSDAMRKAGIPDAFIKRISQKVARAIENYYNDWR